MSFRAEQRADLRALQRAVRDNVTIAEARMRIVRDAGSYGVPPVRHAPRTRSIRTVVALIGLGLVFWTVVIAAAFARGEVVTLCVRAMFVAVGVATVVSIVRDLRTAIRWWRR